MCLNTEYVDCITPLHRVPLSLGQVHYATASAPAVVAREVQLPAPSATASSRPAPAPAPQAAPGGGFGGHPRMNGGAQSAQVCFLCYGLLSILFLTCLPRCVCGLHHGALAEIGFPMRANVRSP